MLLLVYLYLAFLYIRLRKSQTVRYKDIEMNLLLPFPAIPMTNQNEKSLPQLSQTKFKPWKATPKPVVHTSESECSSGSYHYESDPVLRYVPPYKRMYIVKWRSKSF